ncbi:coiled-coil domain-containing protein 22 homolog [Anabrus simplex]|uniref:coiled-coil domain-containing protein 22 homolog n=1 Tax=Anabrus simplex TaxID=316456 RepID=UPI0035A38B45
MEEVDKIIIHNLRQVGCEIEEDVGSLKQFTAELVVEAAVRCLDIIQPGLGLPHSLPPSMSARFRLGANLAQVCMDLGYAGDIGYQTFLYSNEADVRRVFMFLIEKLPKETEKSIVEPSGSREILEKEIREVLKKQLSSPWLPSYCKRKGIRWRDDGTWSREGCGHYQPFISSSLTLPKTSDHKEELSQAWREYYVRHLPLVSEQPAKRYQLLPSLISMNERLQLASELKSLSLTDESSSKTRFIQRIASDIENCLQEDVLHHTSQNEENNVRRKSSELSSRFKLSEKLQFAQEKVHPEKPKLLPKPKLADKNAAAARRKGEEEQVEEVKEEAERLRERLKVLQLDVKQLSAKLTQVSEESSGEERILKDLEERVAVKKRTYDLLPEADSNLSKLQSLVENSAQRLVGLAAQWEKHRAPLLEQYRDAKERNSSKASQSQKQADAVRSLREKGRELSEEIKNKEQLHTQLVLEYEKISKDTKSVSRSAYTRRILEIIGNIRKQKEEIDKVINDTKELQKEINNLRGRLDRSFTDADERIFRDAKKDEAARRAYKLLATLHSDCSELVQMVEETGATVREIRDLEEQIEIEGAKNVAANLERVSADLKQMKQENAALAAQLKSKVQPQHDVPST